MNLGELLVRVGADITDFENKMRKVSADLDKTLKEADKSFAGFDRLGSKLTGIGVGLTAAITAPLGLAVGAATQFAGNFEAAMNRVSALGEITGKDLDSLRVLAMKLGADTQFSAQQAAEGMADLAAAGLKTSEIMKVMPGVLDLAAAGQMSIAQSATIVTDALGQFGLAVGETGRVVDVLAAASAEGKATMSELGATLAYVGPNAKGAGQSLEETTAAIIALDQAGIRGERAGTGLRGVIASLVSPSKEAAKQLDALGISTSDSSGKMRPLSDIMEEFRAKLANVGNEAERQAIVFDVFGREAGASAQVLIAKGGPALDALEQKLISSGGAAERMAKTINSGWVYSMEQFKGSLETAGIALGQAFLPLLGKLLDGLTSVINTAVMPMIEAFKQLPEPLQTAGLALAAIAAAAGPLVLVAGQLITAFGTVGSALTGLTGLLGSGAGLAGLLSAATPLAIAFGVAIAGWAIFKAYTEIQKLNKELERLEKLQKQGTRATEDQAREIKILEDTLKRQRKEVDSTGLSVEEYIKALRDAVKGLDNFADANAGMGRSTKVAAVEVAAVGTETGRASSAVEEHAKTVAKGTTEYAKWLDALNKLRAGFQQSLAAFSAFTAAVESGKAGDEIAKITQNADSAARSVAKIQVPSGLAPDISAATDAAREFEEAWEIHDVFESVNEDIDALNKKVPEATGPWKDFGHQVSTIFTDLGKNIADVLWDGGKSVKQIAVDTFEEMGKAATRFVVEYIEGKLFKALAGLVDDILPGVGQALGGVFGIGGSAATGAASGVASGAGGVASAAGGVGTSVAGAGSGLAGTLSAVGALGSFATGIINAFQMRSMGQDMAAVEENTRYTAIALIGTNGVIDTMRQFMPGIGDIHEYMYTVQSRILAEINDSIGEVAYWAQKVSSDVVHWGSSCYEAIGSLQSQSSQPVTIRFEGGSVRDREFAEYVLAQFTRQMKASQLIA